MLGEIVAVFGFRIDLRLLETKGAVDDMARPHELCGIKEHPRISQLPRLVDQSCHQLVADIIAPEIRADMYPLYFADPGPQFLQNSHARRRAALSRQKN